MHLNDNRKTINKIDKKARHEIILKSGLVFQNFNLFPHYSVLKNVTAAQIRVLKKSREEAPLALFAASLIASAVAETIVALAVSLSLLMKEN